jgi:hypothetical protein
MIYLYALSFAVGLGNLAVSVIEFRKGSDFAFIGLFFGLLVIALTLINIFQVINPVF